MLTFYNNLPKKKISFLLLLSSLFLSLFLNENSSGGSKLDYESTELYIEQFKLGLKSGFLFFLGQIQSPIFYILLALLKSFFPHWTINTIYILISSLLPLIFYNILKIKFPGSNKNYLYSISLLIFFSPYFRSSAIWLTTDNISLIFFSLSIKYFLKIKYNNKSNIILCFIFLALSAYIRQYYSIFVIVFFFELIKKKKNIIFYVLLNLLLALPAIIYYYFIIYKYNIPLLQKTNINFFQSLLLFLSIMFFYTVPFFVFYKNITSISYLFFKNNIKYILILFLFIVFCIYNENIKIDYGGGAIFKLLKKFNLNYYLFYSGLVTFLFILFKKIFEKNYLNYLIIAIMYMIACITPYIFQKYFDPLTLIIFFSIIKSNSIKEAIQMKLINIKYLFIYFLLFLVIANLYYLGSI